MSSSSLRVTASAMHSFKSKIEVLANNLANTQTVGFKRTAVNFSDGFYSYLQAPSVGGNPIGVAKGRGVNISSTTHEMKQGSFRITENPLDWSINGKGFFRIVDQQGNIAYTRNGSFKTDETGRLVTSAGWALDPTITITQDQQFSHISEDGTVWVKQAGSTVLQNLGRINISIFPNPAGLEAIGNSMYLETSASGAQQAAPPKTTGYGSVIGGTVESSNVQIVNEMVDLIGSQRAFDSNSKVIVAESNLDSPDKLIK